ncbi:MAG: hypothetical protein IJX65_05985 [Alistipes sp.]|nr:hypothetical protein [Alistipes sp.]
MKNFLIFLAGFVVGIASLILLGIAISSTNDTSEVAGRHIAGLTLFESPAECLSTRSFEVFQVIDQGAALAREIKSTNRYGNITSDLLVLLINDEGAYYYDEQVVKVPLGKCMRQVGIYQYTTRLEVEKTIPAVKIMD